MMVSHVLLLTTLLLCLLCSGVATTTIDERIVQLSLRAIELVDKLRVESTSGLDDATLYQDGSNAALFVNETVSGKNYCFAIFDTTEATSLADWAMNIDSGAEEICVLGNGPCCVARRGYQRAYAEPSYSADLDLAMFDCFSLQQDIILAGHSAGGAIATVAAVAMSELEPLLLTFGQAESIVGDCDVIDEDKYFHWVNTEVVGGGDSRDYDPVPDLSTTRGTRKYGQLILMSDDEDNVARFLGDNTPSMASWSFNLFAHRVRRYIDRLEMYQKSGGVLFSDGFVTGSLCNVDDECMSGTCRDQYFASGTCS